MDRGPMSGPYLVISPDIDQIVDLDRLPGGRALYEDLTDVFIEAYECLGWQRQGDPRHEGCTPGRKCVVSSRSLSADVRRTETSPVGPEGTS